MEESKKINVIELSTGVKLEALRVNSAVVPSMMAKYPDPVIPKVWIPEKGRFEENPDDPKYLTMVANNQRVMSMAINDAVILFGTKILSVPEGIEDQTGSLWQEKARIIGALTEGGPAETYLAWIKLVACGEQEDFERIWEGVGRLSGVVSKDVVAETARFPSDARGGTN